MKKNSYIVRTRKTRFLSVAAWVAIGIVLLFVTLRLIVPGIAERVALGVAYPIFTSGNYIAGLGSSFVRSFQSDEQLQKENESLRMKVQQSETLAIRNKALEEENRTLHQLLGRSAFRSLVLAPVLRRPPSTPYDTLLVDIGGQENVHVGNRVTIDGHIVAGSLTSKNGNVGVVTLFSTPGIETEVFVGTTTAGVIARGRGSGNFSAEVPKELGVEVGDVVTLTGSPVLILGEILEVESNSADPFNLAFFRIPVVLNRLKWVQIISDNTEEAVFVPAQFSDPTTEKSATTSDEGIPEDAS